MAYPILSVVYVLVLGASAALFAEPITAPRALGTLLVLGGVALVGLSGRGRAR